MVSAMMDGSSGGAQSEDGLSDDLWRRLCEVVRSASRCDADGHALKLLQWRSSIGLVGQQHISAYLLYLLYRAVKTTLGKAPTPADLKELSGSVYPRFREIIRASEIQLEDTFRQVFEFPLLSPPLKPGEFVVFGSAALGILLVNPADELEAMRPGLASWLRRNRERFKAEGLSDLPPTN
jgi:hypothetical protein